jgi:hypothetical protein
VTTKADLINGAYSLIRISGITVDPSGDDLTLALERLEDMAEEFAGRNIITDYNFEQTPTTGSLHNLERKFWFAYKINLAVRLLPDFGKQATPVLMMQQQASFSFISSNTAPFREVSYPTRMPRGLANSRRSLRWSRFNVPESKAPLEESTITMYINDVTNFSESFVAYLATGETISSYTIEAEDGLTITTDANATPLITYTIQADGLSSGGSIGLLQVKIVVTTSASRIETRIINFQLLDSDIT